MSSKDKGICQLTFRLVIVSQWLRNLLFGNVCGRNVCIRIGNTGDAFVAGNVNNVYLCPYSDLWASCPIYLCRDMEILGFQYKNGVLRKLKHIFPNTYQRIKSICSPAKGGTGCYRFNYQPGS